jgi:hypothetical protein
MTRNLTREQALAVALDHAAHGIPVGPCGLTYDPAKNKVNKRPLCRNGFKDFTTNPDELATLFATPTWTGAWAVGGLPGPAGYLVIDIDTAEDLATFQQYDFPPTYTVTTASGGVHIWYRKPDNQPVGNTTTLAGVDCIRSDNGFVIMPGTTSDHGNWETFDDLTTDTTTAPDDLWAHIEKKTGGGPTTTNSHHINGLDHVVRHLTNNGRHQDLDALAILVDHHDAHNVHLRGDTIYVTRPGKTDGISATIGHVGPGVVKVFTGNWPPFQADGRYIVAGDQLVDDDDLTWLPEPAATDPNPTPVDDYLLDIIDFSRLHEPSNDIVDGVITPGRWTAFVAPAKQGKTTFIMNMAVNCSVGIDPFTGATQPPVRVLYLDCEMGRLDLEERIFDLGFEATELTHFYAIDIVPLMDTPDGAHRVITTATHYQCDIVVIDGLNGGLQGEENDSTALRNFFHYTVQPLKTRGIAIVTGDNTGKDVTKGPRGTSVKLDKPDVVFRLARTDNGVRISAVVARSSTFIREEDFVIEGLDGDTAVRYRKVKGSWPVGTVKAAEEFERLGIPVEWSRRRVHKHLRERGLPSFRHEVVTAAQRYRSRKVSDSDVRMLVDGVYGSE